MLGHHVAVTTLSLSATSNLHEALMPALRLLNAEYNPESQQPKESQSQPRDDTLLPFDSSISLLPILPSQG